MIIHLASHGWGREHKSFTPMPIPFAFEDAEAVNLWRCVTPDPGPSGVARYRWPVTDCID